jgi:lysozyme family protein
MSTDNFDPSLDFILEFEGGYVDDPDDPGGATNLGVTIGTLSDWLGHPATKDQVKALTPQTVAPIYKANYWNACRCDELPSGVDLIVFDSGVNCGVSRASKWLQAAVGVTADGVIGPATVAAAAASSAAHEIDTVSTSRKAHYEKQPTFPKYGNGWMSRLDRVTAIAHDWNSPPLAA